MLPGVYASQKKDGTVYYRSGITYQAKHISLGSFSTEEEAYRAYLDAQNILSDSGITIHGFDAGTHCLSFEKIIVLLNFRDNGMYFKTPIYLRKNYFEYYLSQDIVLKFDMDDLFYYASHKIMKRNGHLFVADYGMQVTIASRYGIKNYAVAGRDYLHLNQDIYDYRYSNIRIINQYHGVTRHEKNGKVTYKVRIHINGDFLVGSYSSEKKAAIAYNKAADFAKASGVAKNFPVNFINDCPPSEYADIYTSVKLSPRFLNAFRTE